MNAVTLANIAVLEARIATLMDASKRIGFARRADDAAHRAVYAPAGFTQDQWRQKKLEHYARDAEREALMLPILAEMQALEQAVHSIKAIAHVGVALGL